MSSFHSGVDEPVNFYINVKCFRNYAMKSFLILFVCFHQQVDGFIERETYFASDSTYRYVK